MSASGPTGGGGGAVGERFAEEFQLDTVEVARKFYQSHPDNYDQLLIWTDAAILRRRICVRNDDRQRSPRNRPDTFDASRDFGSAGRLRSFTVMDWIGKYPEDPLQTFLGENNTVSVLGQEVGHRWLAFLDFRDRTGARSESLLGRDQAHWSFFFDSDASVMEGNDIEDLGGGSFRTTAAVQRYSRLDQYAMGLVSASQVPTFFYVDNPTNVAGGRQADSAPACRRHVQRHAPRRADRGRHRDERSAHSLVRRFLTRSSSGVLYLVVGRGRSADSAHIAKLDRIRRAVGVVLPAGHREPDAGHHDAEVGQQS